MSLKHPFTKGQPVRCIKGTGCQQHAQDGGEYTIKRTFTGPPEWGAGDGPLPGMSKEPGVELEEFPGDAYLASRFEAIDG